MMFNMLSPALATSYFDEANEYTNVTHRLPFAEQKCKDGTTIRKYSKHNSNVSYEHTKELLCDLGMQKPFIDSLSQESLTRYAQAESIISIVTYTKTDANGNVEVVDEQTAMNSVTTYSIGDDKINQQIGGFEGAGADVTQEYFQDSYMRICLTIVYIANGKYHFSVDATWLNEPFFRGWDSIGISATHISIHNSSRSGWFQYDSYIQLTSLGESYISEDTVTLPFSDTIQNRITGNWNGSGATFKLPNDSYYSDHLSTQILNLSNFKAHFEFDATIDTPDQTVVFNVTAAYDHSTITLISEPSLSIGLDGVNAIILDISRGNETRIVELDSPITYVPKN